MENSIYYSKFLAEGGIHKYKVEKTPVYTTIYPHVCSPLLPPFPKLSVVTERVQDSLVHDEL